MIKGEFVFYYPFQKEACQKAGKLLVLTLTRIDANYAYFAYKLLVFFVSY